MDVLRLLLLIAGLVLFLLTGFGVGHPRVNLMGLGLACWLGAVILSDPAVTG